MKKKSTSEKKILFSSEVQVQFTIALEWKTWFLFFPDSTKGRELVRPGTFFLKGRLCMHPRIKLIREGRDRKYQTKKAKKQSHFTPMGGKA
jgi:hypothetical protein